MPASTLKKNRSLVCFSIKFIFLNIRIDKARFQNAYFYCL